MEQYVALFLAFIAIRLYSCKEGAVRLSVLLIPLDTQLFVGEIT